MRRAGSAKPHKRDGVWYLIRRVPKEFEQLDRRGIVRVSTGIAVADDPRAVRAGPTVTTLSRELEAYWRGLKDGQSGEAKRRFEEAQRRARSMGVPYMTNEELANSSIEEIKRHIAALVEKGTVEDEADVAAALGGEKRPTLRLSDLVPEYEAIQQTVLAKKSPNQVRKWRNPKLRAVANLTEVLKDDKQLDRLVRNDAVRFRQWWQARVESEGYEIGTANKDIGHISKMLTAVDMLHQLNLPPVFLKLRLAGEEDAQRASFERKWVQDNILATGVMDDLNEDARHIVYVVAELGMRPSEVANLLPEQILLNHKVPHVSVQPVNRELKTKDSVRLIPLVGMALDVMKLHPQGFPRYLDKEDSLSNLVNDYFKVRKWLPTDDHSFYSLRHCFEDRLTAVEAPDKIVSVLMGHKWHRPKYGAGPTLEHKARWLKKILFTPPAHYGPRASKPPESERRGRGSRS